MSKEQLPSILPGMVWSMLWTQETVGPHRFRLLTARSHEEAAAEALSKLDLSNSEHRRLHECAAMFAVLWPVARAGAVALSSVDLSGQRVLELGCGLGLMSLVAAKQGAEVLATDHHPDALSLVERNAEANQLSVRTACVDWREVADLGTFDWVIASDVLFSFDGAEPLANTIRQTLRPGGTGWVVDPARPWHDHFEKRVEALGLRPKTKPVSYTHLTLPTILLV